jgi:hypothetical protein
MLIRSSSLLALALALAQALTAQPACPGATDGRSILESAIAAAHRSAALRPDGAPPAVCLVAAIANTPLQLADSAFLQALDVGDAIRRAQNDRSILVHRIVLASRARRYAEVPATFDTLIATDSARVTQELARMAVIAAHRVADTASMTRALVKASAGLPASAPIAFELQILRQVRRVWLGADTARRVVQANPSRPDGYTRSITVLGTINQLDSVVAYLRLARSRGIPATAFTASMEALVNSMVRHAQAYNAPDGWEPTLEAALAVDSLASTPSTKYLVASAVAHVGLDRVTRLGGLLSGPGITTLGGSRTPISPETRELACPRLMSLTPLLDLADERLRAGGNRYEAAAAVASVTSALAQLRSRLEPLRPMCA